MSRSDSVDPDPVSHLNAVVDERNGVADEKDHHDREQHERDRTIAQTARFERRRRLQRVTVTLGSFPDRSQML